MKNYILLLLFYLSSSSVYASNDFTGFWKGDCSKAFCIQIMPVKNEKFSVSFCGPGGCFEPGTYRPNSTIINDSMYQVVNVGHIKVKGRDGWSDYYKCTTDI